MEISPYQVHNVLRTYERLIKLKQLQLVKETETGREGQTSYDPVSLSPESLEQLSEQAHLEENDTSTQKVTHPTHKTETS